MTRRSRVAIVYLGRSGATGERARVASIRRIFEAADADVDEVALRVDVPVRPGDIPGLDVPAVLGGRAVPESFSWSRRALMARLEVLRPDLVVANTTRSYHPDLLQFGPVVLDFVDRLSVSYRQRAEVTGGVRRLVYRSLALPQERFEGQGRSRATHVIAAGLADARALGATWIPRVVEPMRPEAGHVDVDCVFFGNLAYPPNMDAVGRLAALWPAVQARRPGTSLLLAGRNLGEAQRRLAASHGWLTWPDFPDLASLLCRARLAVVPLQHATGIQGKVLEAAAAGMAQVVSPAAAAGFDDELPVQIAATDDQFVSATCELLADDGRRRRLGERARRHVEDRYTADAYAAWASEVLGR